MTSIKKDVIAGLYNSRFEEFGRDIRTVGWGSAKDQQLRFDVLFRGLALEGKTILDVGCGLGDMVPYLEDRIGPNFRYIGVDIAERLIVDARERYAGTGREFHVGDIFSLQSGEIDIAVLSGALSFKTDGIETYAMNTMRRMFELSREAACLNFLSKYVDFELEKNQHYHPEAVFGWGKALSKKVNLLHDYPLYEFTVQIFR